MNLIDKNPTSTEWIRFLTAEQADVLVEVLSLMKLHPDYHAATRAIERAYIGFQTVCHKASVRHYGAMPTSTSVGYGVMRGLSVQEAILVGEQAVSKLTKAESLGVPVLTEEEFEDSYPTLVDVGTMERCCQFP